MSTLKRIPVFLSVGRPHKETQEIFLKKFESLLSRRGLQALTLGRNNYDYKSPLEPVKELMDKSYGTIILGFERTHCYIGYDKQGSKEEKESIHRYLSTPWNQIEAGMAFQKGLPLLIMKEKHLEPYGILDPKLTGYYIIDLDLEIDSRRFSKEFVAILDKWVSRVKKYYGELLVKACNYNFKVYAAEKAS